MKENQRVAVTKRMLREGLLRLLQTKELRKIKIQELCQESGINRATFYRHYESPQDVLLELEEEILHKLFPAESHSQSMADVWIRTENACRYLYEHADLMKILFRCNTEERVRQKLNELCGRVIHLQRQEKQNAVLDEASVRLVAALLGGGCYCLLREWIMEDIPKTPKQIAAILLSIIHWPNLSHPGEPDEWPTCLK